MRLSILIPSIPSRFDKLVEQYNKIVEMVGDKDIEVLAFTDNKKRTIGEKRDALVQMCKGEYFMFVDDDDELVSLDEIYQGTFQDVDVITFKQECKNNDGSSFVVDFGLKNDLEHNVDDNGNYLDCKRPPFHVCAWNKKYKQYRFPNVNYSEDWGWLKQFVNMAQYEYKIDKVVHKYNFNILVTEASIEDNSEWTNPNKHEKEESDS